MAFYLKAILCSLVLFNALTTLNAHTDHAEKKLNPTNRAIPLDNEPYSVGLWGEVDESWEVLAVHATLLPNGKILAWDATPDDFDEDEFTHQSLNTRVVLWTPPTKFGDLGLQTDTYNRTGTDLFCAGSAHLWDGRVLFSGGDTGENFANGPSMHSNIYNYKTNAWVRADDMNTPRWYSTVVAMANGDMLTVGGTYKPIPYAEVFGLDLKWHALIYGGAFGEDTTGDYQWIIVGPNGNTYGLGPYLDIIEMTTENGGELKGMGKRESDTTPLFRSYGSFAMYDALAGKTLIAGGGEPDNDTTGEKFKASKSAVIVQLLLSEPGNWKSSVNMSSTSTSDMNVGRRQLNLTVLPDQSVLAIGGHSGNGELINMQEPVNFAEIWDPKTEEWTLLSPSERTRQYHSIAILLPDATVLTGGGGYCGDCSSANYFENNSEIFYPPYLFEKGSSELTTDRPYISDVIMPLPRDDKFSIDYNKKFTVISDQAARIKKVTLIKLGSVTHSVNQDQRAMALEYNLTNDRELTVTSPIHRNIAPPGHYMLFILNEKGIPSISQIIKVGQPLLSSGKELNYETAKDEWHYYKIEKGGFDFLEVVLKTYSAAENGTDRNYHENNKAQVFVSKQGVPTVENNDCHYQRNESNERACYIKKTDSSEWHIAVKGLEPTLFELFATNKQILEIPEKEAAEPTNQSPNGANEDNLGHSVLGKKYDASHMHGNLVQSQSMGFKDKINVYLNQVSCPVSVEEELEQAIAIWNEGSAVDPLIELIGSTEANDLSASLFLFEENGIVVNCSNNLNTLGRNKDLSYGLASAKDSDEDGFLDKGYIILNNDFGGELKYFSQDIKIRKKVITHFLGHALGLKHNTDDLSMMNEVVLNTSLELSDSDITNLNLLNGQQIDTGGCTKGSVSVTSNPPNPMSFILLFAPLFLMLFLRKESELQG